MGCPDLRRWRAAFSRGVLLFLTCRPSGDGTHNRLNRRGEGLLALHRDSMCVRSRGSVVHRSVTRISRGLRLAGVAVVTICASGGGVNAQGKLDARYVATLAGVPIGKGAWVIEIGDEQFTAA